MFCSSCDKLMTHISVVLTAFLLFYFICLPPNVTQVKATPEDEAVGKWAAQFGEELWELAQRMTKSQEIKAKYKEYNARVELKNGSELIKSITANVGKMLARKMDAVKCIQLKAEEVFENFEYNETLAETEFQYYSSKFSAFNGKAAEQLLTEELQQYQYMYLNFTLNPDTHFYNISVDTEHSSVHTPSNVYDRKPEVLKTIMWTEELDEVFRQNYQSDPALSWQYFGSDTGILRHFPASQWESREEGENADTYDCRKRSWYIETATCSKDIVILLDNSGSMTGFRFHVAKFTIRSILDTFSNNDFFTIFNYSETAEDFIKCFKGALVQATPENIKVFNDAISEMKPQGYANLSVAYTKAFELLKQYYIDRRCNETSTCNQAIMVVTDGVAGNNTEIFEQYNWGDGENGTMSMKVRIFTYLLGKEVTKVREIQWMACLNRGYYSHVQTLDEVQEEALKYVDVIATPLVLQDSEHPPTWTHAFTDKTITSATSFEQRDYVIRELIDTESNYLDVLNALKSKFMAPLERYLTPEDIKQIFPRIKELADIHTKFLDKLRESLQPNAKMKMSQVFLEFREPFLIYGEYCSCLLGAIDYLGDICKKNQIIEQLVQQCEREYNVGKLQLRDILSVPMQRILKYHLLLDKLVKETSPMHEDYRSLERSKEAMIDVSQYINEVKRDSDHLLIIQKVKDSIIDLNLLQNGNDLLQYGRLLLDGELHIKAHEDQKTKLRYAFVFDKILILVKQLHVKTGDMQYRYRESHNLNEYWVEQSHSRRTIGRDTRFKYQLLLARKSGKTAFTLYLKSEPERDKWRKALTEAMENLDPPGCRNTDHKMEIFTFDAPTTCRHCSKFLKGRIHQGYRCKVCEIAVHKGCISSTGRCKQNIVTVPPPVCDRQLAEFNWFVGNMDRETAQARLEHRRVGTYLLRVRPQGASHPKETMYALSLKTDDNVIKHMKINQDTVNDNVAYCLSSRRHFKNIVELVSYYERNDLGENFAGLNQSLQWPYREVFATAIYDFDPRSANQLQLRTGCQVLVIGKDGDSRGWWRGKIGEVVGYFPREYVQEHPPTNDEL